MSNTFLTSDSHWGHSNILKFFKDDEVTPLRHFSSVEEMDETMIANWNKVVGPSDKVYHLGDLCFHNRNLDAVMPRLNGTKVLIKGNHDLLKLSAYAKYFKDVRAYHQLDKMMLSHIPMHEESLGRWRMNLHGHLHSNKVMYTCPHKGYRQEHPKYLNLSVEHWGYTPVDFETIRKIAADRGL